MEPLIYPSSSFSFGDGGGRGEMLGCFLYWGRLHAHHTVLAVMGTVPLQHCSGTCPSFPREGNG